MSTAHWAIELTIVGSLAYATIRYVLLGPVSTDQLPLFIVNKALSLSGLLLMAASLVCGPLIRGGGPEAAKHPLHPRRLGWAGLVCSALHCGISLLILDPHYFGKFFRPDHRMTWQAEASMLAGLLAVAVMLWQAVISLQSTDHRKVVHPTGDDAVAHPKNLGAAVVILGAAHVLLMGFSGWFQPSRWHASLPPITLIGFSVAAVALLARATTALRSYRRIGAAGK